MSRKNRRGRLSDEDRALWEFVTAGVTPLHPEKTSPSVDPSPPPPAAPPASAGPPPEPKKNGRAAEPARAPSRAPQRPSPPPEPAPPEVRRKLAPSFAIFDRRTLREIFRGLRPVQGRVDLHGLTQAEAYDRLVGFLKAEHARGARLVLVITGKGRGWDEAGQERGVLRRMTPHWLGRPELRDVVLSFSPAGPGHGGEGAFYVRLRKRRN